MGQQQTKSTQFTVANRMVGAGCAPFVVAEISGNHAGDIHRAFELIDAAAAAGADAVKFQTYEADTITIDRKDQSFVVETSLWRNRSLYDLYKEAQTPFAWHERLFSHAQGAGIMAFSAPFDLTAVDLLQSLDCPLYKIASCELVDIPLIQQVAATGKPMIMSTGMASFDEIEEAVSAARSAGASDLALLHCVSGYPSEAKDANLVTLKELQQRFEVPVGLSDHSPGTTMAIAAVALGATIIEKHLCLSRADGSVDSDFSLEPEEFAALVKNCSEAYRALGKVADGPVGVEADSLRFRRSLFVVEDVAEGECFSAKNVRSIRPAGGLHTRYYAKILDLPAKRTIKAGTPFAWDMVDSEGCP